VENQILHDLADLRGIAAMKKEFWRRWHNGLPMAFDYGVVYDRAYREAAHAYRTPTTPEAGRTEETDA